MRRWGLITVVLASAVFAVLVLPRSAQPRSTADLTITKTAPASAYKGDGFDYTITLTYSGTALSDEVTVTDALPRGIDFVSLDINNGTCSLPQTGSSGTVSCTMRFGPLTASSVITIHVDAAQTGTFVNTVQTSTGLQASASTTVTDPPPPPPGTFQVAMSGPAQVLMPTERRGESFPYTITIKYVGPPRTAPVHTRFTADLPPVVQVDSPTYVNLDGVGLSNCTADIGPKGSDGGGGKITAYCDMTIEATRTVSFQIMCHAFATRPGVATHVFTLASGDSASVTTDFVAVTPPPPPPPPPPVLPGPPAAPPQTVTETFTQPGQAEAEAVAVAPAAETVQVALTWPDPSASFDVTGIKLVPSGRALAGPVKLKPGNLKITKKRTKRTLDVRIKNVQRGKLTFKIVAKKVGKSRAKVVAKIRQSKK